MERQVRPAAQKQSFVKGALLLAAGVLVVKVFGALFKIPLSRVITEEGMGYFGTAYSFYNVLFSIAAAGLPVAVSRTVSALDAEGTRHKAAAVRKTALPLFCAVGLVGTVLMYVSAPFYTRAVGNPGALPAIYTLAPSVLLCSAAAAYRGYFEGLCDMTPTAVSQVIEAAAKLFFGLSLALFVMRTDMSGWVRDGKLFGLDLFKNLPEGREKYVLGAAAAIFGVTLGSLLSAIFLFWRNRREGALERTKPVGGERRALRSALLKAALPLTVGAAAASVSGLIDASFMQTRLLYIIRTDPSPLYTMYAGSIPDENLLSPETVPNFLFGCYNMALTLFMLVPSVTQAISQSALPRVTRAFVAGNREDCSRAMETVIRMTCVFAIPAGVGLSVLAEPITRLLYGERQSVPIIALSLSVMGVAAIFAAAATPLMSLLQAAGHMDLPVILTVLGLLIKVVLNYILVGVPQLNILGGGLSTLLSYVFVTAAEWIALRKITKLRFKVTETVMKPLFAALLCGCAALSAERTARYFGHIGRFSAVASVFYAVFIYAAALAVFGVLKKADLQRFFVKEKI